MLQNNTADCLLHCCGIKPGVYLLPGPPRGPSLSITKHDITLLGLTGNRRSVVLADNRGLMQGAEDDGYIIDVNATGFMAKNLTVINYCNADYEYPGDSSKNLHKLFHWCETFAGEVSGLQMRFTRFHDKRIATGLSPA